MLERAARIRLNRYIVRSRRKWWTVFARPRDAAAIAINCSDAFCMRATLNNLLPAIAVLFCVGPAARLCAEEVVAPTPAAQVRDDSWYYQQPTYQPNTRAIIHEKAQARAHQRQARLAAMSWYGMYNARPTAAPTPFTSIYSPVWQVPGGRPYAWPPYSRPFYVTYYR
jgi:hypothetical protein